MEVALNTTEDAAWSCQISLRFMFDAAGKSLKEPQIVAFGERFCDPLDVERALKRAQDAILQVPYSPTWDVTHYLQDDYVLSPKPAGFSRNVVRLDVSGPDLVDVTFIDLPGIIQNSDKVHLWCDALTGRNGSIRSMIWSPNTSLKTIV